MSKSYVLIKFQNMPRENLAKKPECSKTSVLQIYVSLNRCTAPSTGLPACSTVWTFGKKTCVHLSMCNWLHIWNPDFIINNKVRAKWLVIRC